MSGALFFHRGISRLRSEELLLHPGADGSFLVRDSESVAGAYVLCLLYQSRVHQYRILPDKDGRISVQSEGDMQPPSYSDLPSLIHSYMGKGEKNGLVCALRKPVPPEGAEIQEGDSEEEDYLEPKPSPETDERGGAAKTFKFGLLSSFARLDLSCCDGEFVDALKGYVDAGLEKDSDSCGVDLGTYPMPEFQKLLAIAGKGLQRELDLFLLKLSMCHDMLSQEEEDKHGTLTSNPADRLGSYIDFMAAKLDNCRTQILALEKKAKEVVSESSEAQGNEYAYPDCADIGGGGGVARRPSAKGLQLPFLPLGLRRNNSISIPLSTFEVKVLKYGKVNYKLKLTVDIHQGRFFAVKPSKDLLDSSNTFPHDKIAQLVKNTSDKSRLHVIFSNKKKYVYQFGSVLERENFCLQIRQMKSLHSQDTDVDNISVFVGTWNMGKSSPCESLKFWLKCNGEGKSKDRVLSRLPHDIYVIGTQESGMTEKDWINTIRAGLKASLNLDVDLLESCSLWGLRTLVFINSGHRNKISHVQKASVRTGIANALGNKGAVAISFLLSGTSFCFINAHLASGEERIDRRNANYRDILKNLNLGPKNLEQYDITHKFHHVFFFGDLNYRVTEPVELVLNKLEKREFVPLLEQDQLKRCQFEKKVLFGFNEAEIQFMPTYRLERQMPGYKYDWKKVKATGDRINVPSWCDRVLWNSFPGTFIENTAYGCVENLLNSDHRPVFASFTVGIASPFVQNRASLQDVREVKIIFKKIEAEIKTSVKQFYVLEFSSSCLPNIVFCESNNRFGESQKSGFTNNPVWSSDQLPVLRPLFGDIDFLEDQHILIAVKGCGEDLESYGECVISLKDMFTGEVCAFEATMTHFGEETGKMRGEWWVNTGGLISSRANRKTYEIVALDTEYHDPEEFLSLSPPTTRLSDNLPVSASSGETENYVNHEVILQAGLEPAQEEVTQPQPQEQPPPIPTKKAKGPVGGQLVMPGLGPLGRGAAATPVQPETDEEYTCGEELTRTTPQLTTSSPGRPALLAQPQTRLVKPDGASPQGPGPIKPKVLVNVGGANLPLVAKKPENRDVAAALPWQARAEAESLIGASSASSSSSPTPERSKVVPSAPPMPPEENIYPSIAIRKYEELKRPNSVPEWLIGLGLAEYTPVFLRHGWDSMAALPGLNAASIMKMGIKDGEHRLRLLDSVRELRGSSS